MLSCQSKVDIFTVSLPGGVRTKHYPVYPVECHFAFEAHFPKGEVFVLFFKSKSPSVLCFPWNDY